MICDRVKALRKTKGMSQQAFADKLGVPRSTIAGYEIALSEPSNAAVANICSVFNVSESWLRSGEGEMFVDISRELAISSFVGSVLATESDTFKKRLIAMLATLSDEDWPVLEKMALELAKNESSGQ